MRIRRSPLIFNNVISTTASCKEDEWHIVARDLRNAVIKNGLYGTGPIIYQVSAIDGSSDEMTYTFYLPVNEKIEMPENDKYRFTERLEMKDGLVFRHADVDDDLEESYQLIRGAAHTSNLVLLEPFYNIYLDVYGGGLIDIYAPILEVRGND